MYSFPSSSLGMQTWKLQLPVSRSWSFGFAVPKLELGNQKNGVANLVLACTDCNRGVNGKFAHLPALPLLQRLHERNEYLNDFVIAIHVRKIIIGLIPFHNCPTALVLVPKLQLGNADLEAPASSLAKLELRLRGSQASAWEPEDRLTAWLIWCWPVPIVTGA